MEFKAIRKYLISRLWEEEEKEEKEEEKKRKRKKKKKNMQQICKIIEENSLYLSNQIQNAYRLPNRQDKERNFP